MAVCSAVLRRMLRLALGSVGLSSVTCQGASLGTEQRDGVTKPGRHPDLQGQPVSPAFAQILLFLVSLCSFWA